LGWDEPMRDPNNIWMSSRDLQKRLGKQKFAQYEQFLVTTYVFLSRELMVWRAYFVRRAGALTPSV
jgi:hypothetical protein